jgi:phosphatidylglycerol:prolipoprotein diacylglycerol transferase
MYPVIAKIGPLSIYSYGLMVALGFAVAIILCHKDASKFGIDKDKVVDFGICILLGGLLGARFFYVLSNLSYYISNPIEVVDLTKGGLVWYGGFLTGLVVALVFVRVNKINFWDGADLLAPFIPLAQAIGRIGCFLNGCCYGVPAQKDFPLGVLFPGDAVWRHPSQLYECLALLAIFLALRAWQSSRRFKGEIFLGYGILYSVSRFFIEFVRGDHPRAISWMTMSQIVSIAIFFSCLAMLVTGYIVWKKKS